MTIPSKRVLEFFVLFVAAAGCTSFAQISATSAASAAPLAASAPTVVPALVPYSGLAIDREGRALSGETGITFLIFKDPNGGEPLFTETQSVVPDSTGRYTVRLGATMSSGLPMELFSTGEARWLEIQTAGQKPQPRVLLMSVPYALKAADASTLGGLPASAFALAGAKAPGNATGFAPVPMIPDASSTVTTTGGTANKVAKFSGTSTIVNSILFDNGTQVGVNTTSPTATLTVAGTETVNGAATLNGAVTLPALATATAAKGNGSQSIQFNGSAYNSTSKAVVAPKFLLKSEVTSNDTASPNATLNVLASATSSTPAETGLYINTNGTIHFAAGQTFPGGGSSGGSFCIAVNGGFGGSGGTTFIAPTFVTPSANGCSSWSGFTKTADTVVLNTNGAACLSTDSKVLTLSATSADPSFLGTTPAFDYIQLSRTGTSGTFTTGSDQGPFSGPADQITCTSSLLQLPASHD